MQLSAKKSIIKGSSQEYAEQTLYLLKFSDLITMTEELIDSAIVDKNGLFEFSTEIDQATTVFINLGVYRGFITIEPEVNYEILLPKRKEKSMEDFLNPYFKRQEFYFTIKNTISNDLNSYLYKFDIMYNKALYNIFRTSYARYKKSKIDSIIAIVDSNFMDYKNTYFINYKEYSYATLRTTAYMRDKEDICNTYFKNKDILYDNPAYMNLFNETFYKCFTSNSSLIDWNVVRVAIAKESLSTIDNSMALKDIFAHEDFRHLVIIKGLYDLFYSDTVNKDNVLAILDSLQSTTSITNRKIINNFWNKATKLMVEKEVPFFELPDKNGKLLNIKEMQGSFIYLNFYHPQSYVCKRQIELLKALFSYKIDLLKIVTIFVGEDIQEMEKFMEKYDCDWTFLFYDKNMQLLEDYKVVVYPTYYLINPEGKLISSPAKTPEEDFEYEYNNNYMEWKREQLKKTKDGKMLGP